MLKALLIRVAAVVCSVACGLPFANAQSCPKPQVFYVNGVWNENTFALMESPHMLNDAFLQYGAPAVLNVRTIFNPGDGTLDDIFEVIVRNKYFKSAGDFLDAVTPLIVEKLVLSYQYDAARLRNQAVIDKIKSYAMAEINQKHPFVFVAHSQGNMLVNEAVRQMQFGDSIVNPTPGISDIGILGIGVADSAPAGNHYRYITSTQDKIIVPLPGSLAANFVPFDLAVASVLDPTSHFVTSYLDPSMTGYYNQGTNLISIREQVARLFLEVYNEVQAAWPCVSITPAVNPTPANFSARINVAVAARVGDTRSPTGSVTLSDSSGDICVISLNSNALGLASGFCDHTFNGAARIETVTARYSGDSVFKSGEPASFDQLIGDPVGYWRMSYSISNCALDPPTAVGTWVFGEPCTIGIPVDNGNGSGTIYFDDVSNDVVFQTQSSNAGNIRTVMPLAWRSNADVFSFSFLTGISQAYYIPGRPSLDVRTETGQRTFQFNVTARTATQMSGTFRIDSTAVYTSGSNTDAPYWNVLPSISTGNWAASFVAGVRPQTVTTDFFCFPNNSTMQQMAFPYNGTGNPSIIPAWNSPTGGSGCVYGSP